MGGQLLADQRKEKSDVVSAKPLQGHCGAGRCPRRQSQGKALDTSAPTASYQRTQCSQILEGAKLYFHREEMGQGQLPTAGVGPPGRSGLSRWWIQGNWPMGTPLCHRGRNLFPPVEDRSSTAAGQVPCDTHALEKERPLCLKQGKIIPHSEGGPAQVGQALSHEGSHH